MEQLDRCVTTDDVADFVSDALTPRARVAFEAHVARCPTCRTLLSLVARSDSVGQASRDSAISGSSWPDHDAWSEEPAPGMRVDRYLLGARLGAGAMGVVFAAYDPELDRQVAVKVLRNDARDERIRTALTARLLREAQAMAQLAHPNVVAVHDVGWFGDRIFIAMELVHGQTLTAWLAADDRPLREVLAVFVAAGKGLAAAHAAGLVHRDFKPDNVLVGHDGRVRVSDFGLAHRAAEPAERVAILDGEERGRRSTAALAGTPFYMAPEQLVGERVDARSDQFSFCVAICAALTGAHPFSPGRRSAGPPRRHGLPAWLWRAVQPGLATARDQRYPSMDVLLARLAPGLRPARWVWPVTAAVALAVIAATTAGVSEAERSVGPTCEGAARLLADAWDPARARAIDAAFRASGRADAAESFAATSLLLDQYAHAWIALRTEACERRNVHGDPGDTVLKLRVACLDARRSELRALTTALVTADAARVDGAVTTVQALGPLATCADDDALQRPMRPDVAARAGAVAAVDGARRTSLFETDAEGTLWQVRGGEADGDRARIAIIDSVIGRPVIVLGVAHRLELLVRRAENRIWHGWQDRPGGAWHGETLADAATDDPALAAVGDDLVYFVRRADGWLWRYWRAGPSGAWIGARVTDAVAGAPGVSLDVAGALHVFVRKADSSLWYARQRAPGEPIEAPVKLFERIAGDPVAMRDGVGKMTYFVRRTDGSLIAGYQQTAGSPIWHAVQLTTGVAGNATVALDAAGKQVCLIRTATGALWSGRLETPSGGAWLEAIVGDAIADDPALILDGHDRLTFMVHRAGGALWQAAL